MHNFACSSIIFVQKILNKNNLNIHFRTLLLYRSTFINVCTQQMWDKKAKQFCFCKTWIYNSFIV